MATNDQRAHMLALCEWFISEAPLGYSQARPMKYINLYEQQLVNMFAQGQKIQPDCSGAVALICKMAGLADPNGLAYDGYGGTESMMAHLPHYTKPIDAHTGALVIFGPAGATTHVAMVMTHAADPLLFSHGSSAGPMSILLSDEKRAHTNPDGSPSPVTFLDIGTL